MSTERVTSPLPGVQVLRSYRREWLRADLVAGAVLAALLLPQGMAYAQLAGMPPVEPVPVSPGAVASALELT